MSNKIIAIIIHKNNDIYKSKFNLEDFNFFVKNSIKELILFCTKEISNRIDPNIKYKIIFDEKHRKILGHYNLQNTICNSYKKLEYTYLIISTNVISSPIINDLLDKISNDHTLIDSIINTRVEVDLLFLIKKDTNDIKDNLLISINNLLQRGEKLEDLIDKSTELSYTTKKFSKETKKLSCCNIL